MAKTKAAKGREGKRGNGGEGQPEPVQARARARGPDPEVWAKFCERISEGKVERVAAMGLGVPYTTIRSWMDAHPEMREQLLDARAVEIQRRSDRLDQTPFEIGAAETKTEDGSTTGLHPKAAELLMKHDRWRLECLDPEAFLPAKKLEHTGKDGGPVKAEVLQGIIRLPPSDLRKK